MLSITPLSHKYYFLQPHWTVNPFLLIFAGGGEVFEFGSPESSLHSSRHGQWVWPRQSGRFCSGKAWRVGLPGSQPHWPKSLQHVGGRCGAHQVADEGNAAFWWSVSTLNEGSALICVCVCMCVCVSVFVFLPKVNFFSYIQMAWKALAYLEQSKGSLVIVSSLLGRFAT